MLEMITVHGRTRESLDGERGWARWDNKENSYMARMLLGWAGGSGEKRQVAAKGLLEIRIEVEVWCDSTE